MARVLDPHKDLVNDDVKKSMRWIDVESGMFEYEHSRPMPVSVATNALKYINAITAKYPFQIRFSMAKPLWQRFADAWCDTGDENYSMGRI